jgi:hypothetical protein
LLAELAHCGRQIGERLPFWRLFRRRGTSIRNRAPRFDNRRRPEAAANTCHASGRLAASPRSRESPSSGSASTSCSSKTLKSSDVACAERSLASKCGTTYSRSSGATAFIAGVCCCSRRSIQRPGKKRSRQRCRAYPPARRRLPLRARSEPRHAYRARLRYLIVGIRASASWKFPIGSGFSAEK